MPDGNTLRIFAFTGGGTKGYGSNRFMQKFMRQWGVTDLCSHIDVICGTSIGAILACGYAIGKTPDELESFFLNDAKRIFTIRTAAETAAGSHDASEDSNRPNLAQKAIMIAQDDAFYKSAFDDSNYGTNILQERLIDNFGTKTLADLRIPIVIPAFEVNTTKFVMFSNFNDPAFFIGNNETIVNVCRASSAAPVYFSPYAIDDRLYSDGGTYANDPTKEAINIGLTIKAAKGQNVKRIVVITVGTGIGNMSFDGGGVSETEHTAVRLFGLFNQAMTGAEEGIKHELSYKAERLGVGEFYYYKFQPKFPIDFPNELDNSTLDWFNNLASLIDLHYSNQSGEIASILTHLTA